MAMRLRPSQVEQPFGAVVKDHPIPSDVPATTTGPLKGLAGYKISGRGDWEDTSYKYDMPAVHLLGEKVKDTMFMTGVEDRNLCFA